ncbi:MAG: DUF4214 domain-containing protein [Methylococcaceae bacterium]|nr:DUF4214 domain-containing protein [Methylococcaceae bacterium]
MYKFRFIIFSILYFWVLNASASPLAGATQYTAKLYTEVLGRIPDQTGWNNAMTFWQSGPCNRTRLKEQGMAIFNSSEFNGLNLDNPAKILVLYRAIMLREPDQSGYNNFLNHLNNGLSTSQIASIFYDSGEFLQRANSICKNEGSGWIASTPLDLADPSSSYFSGGTGEELQSILDAAITGSTVFLAKRAIIRVHKPINVPNGITLATIGFPSTRYYTSMARIVRDSGEFEGKGFELIQMYGSAKVKNIWIDGRRSAFGFSSDNINVRAYGGNGSFFSENKVSDTAGWTSFQIWGTAEGFSCSSSTINSNMITLYGSSHYNQEWADGLSIGCENAIVENNDILDATDVAIVVYRSGNATQNSKVKYNRVLNAGHSAYGGLGVDPLFDQSGDGNYNFTGTQVFNNTVWSSSAVHIDIVLAIGTKPWFGDNADSGFGAKVYKNTSGLSTVNSNNGIVVSGIHSAYVQSNNLNNILQNSIACPTANVIADISSGNASGNIQSYQDILIQGCIGHE